MINPVLPKEDMHNYQVGAKQHIMDNTHCGVFLDMGLGKTVTVLTAILELYSDLIIDTVLIIAPKRVVESVWDAEINKWQHLSGVSITKIIGTEKQRKAKLKEKTLIHIISRDNVVWLCGQFGGNLPYNMLVVDESSSFKNHDSKRFKALKLAQPGFDRVVILTGTPVPNGLIDLWAQIYLLDRGERLYKTISTYKEVYFRVKPYSHHEIELMPDSDEKIHKKIADICVSMKAEDYLDLPKALINDVEVDFDEALLKKYNTFKRDRIMEIVESGDEITAVNATVLSNKLLQFANGAMYDEERKVHTIHDLKLDAVEEIVECANGRPVLIAYTYQHDATRILERLKRHNPVKLDGDDHVRAWNRGEIKVLIMHPASGGHGLNLQYGGNIIVWFGQTWSLELYQQLNKRLDRQGQEERVIIHRIIAKNTWDEKVITVVEGKDVTQASLMRAVKAEIARYKMAG
jgi:SNF2 family DNA or RNA helicase